MDDARKITRTRVSTRVRWNKYIVWCTKNIFFIMKSMQGAMCALKNLLKLVSTPHLVAGHASTEPSDTQDDSHSSRAITNSTILVCDIAVK